MLRSSLDPLGLTTSSDTLGGEELPQVPMLRLTPSIGTRTSKLKQSLVRSDAIGGDLLLDRLNKMVHEGTSEIKTTVLGVKWS
jgi:hypothetical protein